MTISHRSSKNLGKLLRWLVWFLAVSFFFYEFLLRVSPSVMVDSLMATFSADAATIGALTAVYYYIYAPMQFPVGLLMDRFGPRLILPLAAIVCGISAIIYGLSPNLEILGAARFLTGFGSSFAFVGLLFITSHFFPLKQMALLIGIANSIAMIGGATGEGPLSVVEDFLGWRNSMVWLGSAGILLGLCIFVVIHKIPAKHRINRVSFREAWKHLIRILSRGRSWLNASIALFIYASTAGFAALWAVPFLMNNHSMTRDVAGFASSTIYIGWIVAGPLLGHLSDRVGKRAPFLRICSLCAGLTLLPLVLLTGLPHTLIFVILFFVGAFSTAELLNFSIAIEDNPEEGTGSAIAFTNFMVMVGGAIFQPFVGWLLDQFWTGTHHHGIKAYSTGDYKIAILCFPICFFIAFTLSFFLKEKKATI